jgi:hypothetical protein
LSAVDYPGAAVYLIVGPFTGGTAVLGIKTEPKESQEGSKKQYPFHTILHPAFYFPPPQE